MPSYRSDTSIYFWGNINQFEILLVLHPIFFYDILAHFYVITANTSEIHIITSKQHGKIMTVYGFLTDTSTILLKISHS